MKKELVYFLLALALYYVISVTVVASRCEAQFGWNFHSMFPVPTCNVMTQTYPLEDLEKIRNENFEIVDI